MNRNGRPLGRAAGGRHLQDGAAAGDTAAAEADRSLARTLLARHGAQGATKKSFSSPSRGGAEQGLARPSRGGTERSLAKRGQALRDVRASLAHLLCFC